MLASAKLAFQLIQWLLKVDNLCWFFGYCLPPSAICPTRLRKSTVASLFNYYLWLGFLYWVILILFGWITKLLGISSVLNRVNSQALVILILLLASLYVCHQVLALLGRVGILAPLALVD